MKINEIFDSIQGEGSLIGTPCTFIRTSGCNLKCEFCDTEHNKYKNLQIKTILRSIHQDLVVITGGEPTLQADLSELCGELVDVGKTVAIETNGIKTCPGTVHHVSLSPKTARSNVILTWCTDLKLLYPYLPHCDPKSYANMEADNYFIQPISGCYKEAIAEVMRLGHPWRLSPQLHKLLEVK
jgi:organic radical activating enzyme